MTSYTELKVPDGVDDQFLYHFTKASTAIDHILNEGNLRLSPYTEMRDPLENKNLSSAISFQGDLPDDGTSIGDARELVDALKRKMRILSLTMDATGYIEDADRVFGRGYARSRMWEAYADIHTGVCLAFSANAMVTTFLNQLKAFGPTNIGPVDYSPGGFAAHPGAILDASKLTAAGTVPYLTSHIVDKKHNSAFWFLKQLDWETEFEYRLVVFAPQLEDSEPIFVPIEGCLKAIVVGERFDDNNLDIMRMCATSNGVSLWKLNWETGRPSAIRL